MLLIGLGYKARQGKNTAALAMLDAAPLDADIRLVSFADALRKEVNTAARQMGGFKPLIECLRAVGMTPEWVHPAPPLEKQRTLLQWWGTDYRRAGDPDYWVKRLMENLNSDIAIVTDVRYPNEVAAIKARGGVVVKVERTTPPDVVVQEHASETALDGFREWDYFIKARTVRECRHKAADIFAEIVRSNGKG